jgi:ribokinase
MAAKMVTVVGSYNVGLFLKGERLPVLGETVIADQFVESGGGKGSNQAVAAARFGAETRFIGRIGDDSYGRYALDLYDRLGISTESIQIDRTIHSGISIILIDKEGNNLISVAPGANLNLSRQDIDGARAILQASAIVGFQLENSHDTVFYALRQVHGWGVPTFLDPAPAAPLPDDLYPCIDIIKPNETEAGILTGLAVSDVPSALAAGEWFLARGVRTAVITLGKAGAVLATGDVRRHFPAPPVEARDSTGAGDIFSGAFLAATVAGQPLADAIWFAVYAATLSTTRLGVIESIPDRDEVETFMRTAV